MECKEEESRSAPPLYSLRQFLCICGRDRGHPILITHKDDGQDSAAEQVATR